jgi:hypothetical protein
MGRDVYADRVRSDQMLFAPFALFDRLRLLVRRMKPMPASHDTGQVDPLPEDVSEALLKAKEVAGFV